MPRCDGRPDGLCPSKVNCKACCTACDEFRFPLTSVVQLSSLATTDTPQSGQVVEQGNAGNSVVDRKLIVNELLCFFSE